MRYLSLLGVAIVLASCGGGGREAAPPTTAARPAPEVAGRTLDRRNLSLAALRGKAVVVNVWSSW